MEKNKTDTQESGTSQAKKCYEKYVHVKMV